MVALTWPACKYKLRYILKKGCSSHNPPNPPHTHEEKIICSSSIHSSWDLYIIFKHFPQFISVPHTHKVLRKERGGGGGGEIPFSH